MKKSHAVFVAGILIVFIAVISLAFVYSNNSVEEVIENVQVNATSNQEEAVTGLSDIDFKTASGDPDSKILAKGDLNGDGYEDAIVQIIQCGASCSISLQVVFNNQNKSAEMLKDKKYPDTFSPAYKSSSATKSEVTDVSIVNGLVSLTGKGLMCEGPSLDDVCTEEKWNVIKTAIYKFDGSDMVLVSVK